MGIATRNIKSIKDPDFYSNEKFSFIIPAAGMGKRMKSFGAKPLIKVNPTTTILDNQLRIINNVFPNNEIILIAGYDGDYLMNHSPNSLIKIENERYEDTNVCRSIGMGLRAATTERVVIVYGDLVFNEETLRHTKFRNLSTLIVGSSFMKEEEIGCTYDEQTNLLQHMDWNIKDKWDQISYFTGRELKLLKNICWDKSNEKLFGFECINNIVNNNGKFAICKNKGKTIDIDTSKDLERVIEIL